MDAAGERRPIRIEIDRHGLEGGPVEARDLVAQGAGDDNEEDKDDVRYELVARRAAEAGCTLAGNVFAVYADRLPVPDAAVPRVEALPTAAALLRLAPALLAAGAAVSAEQALPLYIRDKVAKTTLERAAEKAAL